MRTEEMEGWANGQQTTSAERGAHHTITVQSINERTIPLDRHIYFYHGSYVPLFFGCLRAGGSERVLFMASIFAVRPSVKPMDQFF